MDTRAIPANGVTIRSFPALSDGGPTRHGAIGLVALATDHVCELDLRQIIPQDRIPVYVGRIGFAPEITVETLGAMRDGITAAASLILAGGRLDVLAYGCTSGTMVIGDDEVFARLRSARPGVACTTPPTAALAALKALGVRRIAVLTPYTEGVNRRVLDYFTARGLDIAAFGAFNKGSDAEIAAIAPASIVEAAQALDAPDIEGIFLSCTGLRGAAVVEALETRLGKPVITSNQAMAWHALRLAGHAEPVPGFGRLLRL
ncbi:MAG TPA: aspartate/glutamate racemase family protein [Stellaceae bacterium]|jgi:maleate isomerase|nr:aspartate/glutamate racemase family protein [Stellaceae bacterium]